MYKRQCSHFLVFCIDYHKLRVAAGLHGEQTPPFESTIDGYTVGVIDASLAMMSAVTVAESLGLGCCCIGYTRTADPRRISDLLLLPEEMCIRDRLQPDQLIRTRTIGQWRKEQKPDIQKRPAIFILG